MEENPFIEIVGPATRMITLWAKDAVYFAVEHLEHREWVTVWSRTVPRSHPDHIVAMQHNQKNRAKEDSSARSSV